MTVIVPVIVVAVAVVVAVVAMMVEVVAGWRRRRSRTVGITGQVVSQRKTASEPDEPAIGNLSRPSDHSVPGGAEINLTSGQPARRRPSTIWFWLAVIYYKLWWEFCVATVNVIRLLVCAFRLLIFYLESRFHLVLKYYWQMSEKIM